MNQFSLLDHRHDLSDAKSVDSAFSIDSGLPTTPEVFDHDFASTKTERLLHELQRVKEDLQLKEKEIRRANEIRENTDREIEDLTASLFESAHSMVDQAKHAQANAEEKLKTSNQTIDALTLENTQLKKSVHELKEILNTCRTSSETSVDHPSIDNILLREFLSWQDKPSIERDSSLFMHRIYKEDITPCLTFPNAELSSKVLVAIERNDMTIELCQSKDNIKNCSFMGERYPCDYRLRLRENGPWYPLSRLARNRIVSVCDFCTFIRHVQSGLVKSDAAIRFNKIIELRKQMAFTRLGL